MLLVSKGFKKALLGPTSFAQIFAGGQLRLFAGARPTAADAAEPSAPIAVIERAGADPGLRFLLSGEFVVKPPADHWRLKGRVSATALWWRLVADGDTAGASFDAPRIDGDVGTVSAPAEMVLATTAIVAGTILAFDTFAYTLPPIPTA